ncbi:hypothetical protein IGI04_030766 [Brassica rapa subsp. trilocularis]|uniref:Uncharacterized protein n=1 Tax=Brassica rapa subsp. trilocularis TaxID=1813537 RepID=A0ABQ7LTA5_BRACM|nr:hypothetical protein IGI04_030766 [Brassica rapa subsp. trilocularis]
MEASSSHASGGEWLLLSASMRKKGGDTLKKARVFSLRGDSPRRRDFVVISPSNRLRFLFSTLLGQWIRHRREDIQRGNRIT